MRTKLGWPFIRTIIYTFIRRFQIINYIYESSGRTHHDFLSLNTKVNNAFGGRTAYLTAISTTFTTIFAKFNISKWCKRVINTSVSIQWTTAFFFVALFNACKTIIVSASPWSKACFTRTPSCRGWNEEKSLNFSFPDSSRTSSGLLEWLCSFSH